MATDIRIIGMNGNSVDPIPNTKLYRYGFRLSQTPAYDWKILYEQTARGGGAGEARRRSSLVDDSIIVEMSAEDDKQQQLDFQKELVAEINRKYDAAQDLVARDLAAREQKRKDEEDELQRLRDETKQLKF